MLNISNHNKIREIRLARPPVNALNMELVKLLTDHLRDAYTKCDAVVLTGREGMFSAGLDVVDLLQLDHRGMTEFWSAFFELLETIACAPLPVAAAVTGHSPAGGAVICLMCDYRVMSRGSYKIGLNETRVGLVLPALLQNALARLVGPRTAEQMLVAGTLIDPEEAYKIGLVDALESSYDATVQSALDWTEKLLSLPRHSMLGNRAVIRAHFKQAFFEHDDVAIATFVNGWFSDETQNVLQSLVAQLKSK